MHCYQIVISNPLGSPTKSASLPKDYACRMPSTGTAYSRSYKQHLVSKTNIACSMPLCKLMFLSALVSTLHPNRLAEVNNSPWCCRAWSMHCYQIVISNPLGSPTKTLTLSKDYACRMPSTGTAYSRSHKQHLVSKTNIACSMPL